MTKKTGRQAKEEDEEWWRAIIERELEEREAEAEARVLRTEVQLRGLLEEIGTPQDFPKEALENMRKSIGGTLKVWRMANKAGISDLELEEFVICFLALHWEGFSDLEMKELLEAIQADVIAKRQSLRMLKAREYD